MLLKFKAPTNKNGWSRQLLADTEERTIKFGSFLFHDGITLKSENELKNLRDEFIDNGFTLID